MTENAAIARISEEQEEGGDGDIGAGEGLFHDNLTALTQLNSSAKRQIRQDSARKNQSSSY